MDTTSVAEQSKDNQIVGINERIRQLDLLRGIAVLGILAMNIQFFAAPFSTYMNPTSFGDFTGYNFWIWASSHLIFDQKFMSIFSMLFGVGILIFSARVEQRESHSGKRHYLRMLFLLGFGLIHAFFIWSGDILITYALCGVFAYLFKDCKTKTLWIWAVSMFAITSLLQLSNAMGFQFMTEEQIQNDILSFWRPTAEAQAAEIAAYQGSWAEVHTQRTEQTLEMLSYVAFYFPRVLAQMLIGMALFKSGFFQGKSSTAKYTLTGLILVILGYCLTAYGIRLNIEAEFYYAFTLPYGNQFNFWGSIITAIGYSSLVFAVGKGIDQHRFKRALANVGQMAFTNYILQSIICTFIFYGFGFGLFAEVDRLVHVIVTVSIWVGLIIFSGLWLSRYKMGPLEYLWRGLTYQSWRSNLRSRLAEQ